MGAGVGLSMQISQKQTILKPYCNAKLGPVCKTEIVTPPPLPPSPKINLFKKKNWGGEEEGGLWGGGGGRQGFLSVQMMRAFCELWKTKDDQN